MTVAASLGQAIQLIVVKYWLQMYDFFPMIALTFALSFAGIVPVLAGALAAHRQAARHAERPAAGCRGAVGLGRRPTRPARGDAGVHGRRAASLTGSLTLVMSSAIDVVDFDELETGERREGAYFGIWTLGLKLMSACGILLSGALLQVVGYVPDQPQSCGHDVVAGDDGRAVAVRGVLRRAADVPALPLRSRRRGARASRARRHAGSNARAPPAGDGVQRERRRAVDQGRSTTLPMFLRCSR